MKKKAEVKGVAGRGIFVGWIFGLRMVCKSLFYVAKIAAVF